MSNSSTFEFLVLFDTLLIGMLVLFGQGTTTSVTDIISTPISILNQPFLTFADTLSSSGFRGFSNCGFLDFNCNASNIAQATLYAGALIGYGGLLFLQILQKIGSGVFLIIGIGNGFGSDLGVPFLGYI